jgi:hypothetical protein
VTEAELKELLAKTESFLRKRSSLNQRTAAAALGNVLTRSQAGTQAYLPQAKSRDKLSPQEAEDAKDKLRKNLVELEKLKADQGKPVWEKLKQSNELKKQAIISMTNLTQADLDAAVRSTIAKEGIRERVTKDIRDDAFRRFKQATTTGDEFSRNLRKIGVTGPEGLASLVGSFVQQGATAESPVLIRDQAEKFKNIYAATMKDEQAVGILNDAIIAEAYSAGAGPQKINEIMGTIAATLDESNPDLAQVVRSDFANREEMILNKYNQAMEAAAIKSDEFMEKVAIGGRLDPNGAAVEMMKAFTTLGIDLDDEELEQKFEKAKDMVDQIADGDPELRKKFLEGLDKFDTDGPVDQTLRMAREEFFNSELMQKYMEETGITDPRVALRQLRSELKQDQRSVRMGAMQARNLRRKNLREGAKGVPEDTGLEESKKTSRPRTVGQLVTNLTMGAQQPRLAVENTASALKRFASEKLKPRKRAKATEATSPDPLDGAGEDLQDETL